MLLPFCAKRKIAKGKCKMPLENAYEECTKKIGYLIRLNLNLFQNTQQHVLGGRQKFSKSFDMSRKATSHHIVFGVNTLTQTYCHKRKMTHRKLIGFFLLYFCKCDVLSIFSFNYNLFANSNSNLQQSMLPPSHHKRIWKLSGSQQTWPHKPTICLLSPTIRYESFWYVSFFLILLLVLNT